jgi:uncharacterized SAM-binding protein YcdF (DUF218 family)
MTTIMQAITDFIFVSNDPKNADVIIIPGGSDPALPEKAAELFASGYAPYVIPTGGVSVKSGKFNGVKRKTDIYSGDYQSDCEFMTDVLLKNGVPQSAILSENVSGFTKENAMLSRKVVDEQSLTVKSAIIVCKSFHARRCQMVWQFAFPDAEIIVAPVDVYDISRDNWFKSEYGVERVLGELSRCGNQTVDEIKANASKSEKDYA